MLCDYLITILTPAYNRADKLPALYDSLLQQTDSDFQWLIVDDGSIDNTEAIVSGFHEHKFELTYVKKENGGKHTALNYAHDYIKGELTAIVDSDDWLLPEAIAEMKGAWRSSLAHDTVKVLCFLKGRDDNHEEPVCRSMPEKTVISNSIVFRVNARRTGDCFEVIATDVLKEFPFPIHAGERFMGESYLWNRSGYKYDTVYIHKILYICDYLEDGLTKQGRALRIRCPLGSMDVCNTFFLKENGRAVKGIPLIKEALLFVSYGKFAGWGCKRIVNACYRKDLARLFYLPGCVLYHYWKAKYL